LDERQIRALIVARQFLDRAELLAADGTVPGRMAAVVLADLSVETAAKSAVLDEALPAKARLDQDPSLPVVLEALVELWQKRPGEVDDVPEAREARRLHELRNSVQHAGLAPDADQVVDARLRAHRFLAWVAKEWFGTDLEAISRGLLIEHEGIRSLVQDAEQLFAHDDFATAADRLAIAFEMARREFRAEAYKSRSTIWSFRSHDVEAAISEVRKGSVDRHGFGYRRFERVMKGIAVQLERLDDQIEALSLGARMSDYAWFQRHFPGVEGMLQAETDEQKLYTLPLQVPITREVCLRGLEFVTTAALHWQEFPEPPAGDDSEEQP
jgi:hypothetical protein